MALVQRTEKDSPPELDRPFNRIVAKIDSYVEMFTKEERRLTEITEQFQRIGKDVEAKRKQAKAGRIGVRVLGVFATFSGDVAAPETAASLADQTLGVLVYGLFRKCGYAAAIKKQGNEFNNIVGPMYRILKEVEVLGEELQKRTENLQCEGVKEVQGLVRQVKSTSAAGKRQAMDVNNFFGDLLDLNTKLVGNAISEEEIKEMCHLLIGSGAQYEATVSKLRSVKNNFVHFKEALRLLNCAKTV